jgi:DNA polymerase-3 subunit alpha
MYQLVISEFQSKIQEIQLIVKAYQLKEASDAIRQQFGEKQTATVSKQEYQRIRKYWLIQIVHLHNHTILRFTIYNKYCAIS